MNISRVYHVQQPHSACFPTLMWHRPRYWQWWCMQIVITWCVQPMHQAHDRSWLAFQQSPPWLINWTSFNFWLRCTLHALAIWVDIFFGHIFIQTRSFQYTWIRKSSGVTSMRGPVLLVGRLPATWPLWFTVMATGGGHCVRTEWLIACTFMASNNPSTFN